MKRIVGRPSPATAISLVALFVSLSGVTYAATVAPRGSVATTSIRSGAVTGPKIRKRAVTQARIAPRAVGTTRLADRAITAGKLAPGAVGAAALAPSSVSGAAVTDGAVGTADLADSAVTGGKIAGGAVTRPTIGPGAVTGAAVADGSLTGADIDVASLGVVRTATVRQANGPQVTVAPGGSTSLTASCLPGERVVGGGEYTSSPVLALNKAWPAGDGSWEVVYTNPTAAAVPAAQVVAFATCVTG